MHRTAFTTVHEIAADQFGYVTAAQAAAAGVDPTALRMMAHRGTVERVGHGLYRVPTVPAHPLAAYRAATLWPRGAAGILSHETALELLELSDVSPDRIHVTVPRAHRVRRPAPRRYALHHADLGPGDVTAVEGIPVTTAARAIRDCAAAGLAPAQVRRAIDDGVRRSRVTAHEAHALRALIHGTPGEAAEHGAGHGVGAAAPE